jgi:YfiH family protein
MKPYLSWDLGSLDYQLYLEKPNFDFHHVHQVHGISVIDVEHLKSVEQADGLVGSMEILTLKPWSIKTADCLPVILISPTRVAFLHLGWRGLQQKLIHHTLLQHAWEKAFIGPSIGACCFEVTEEFFQHFPDSKDLFEQRQHKHYFDLKRECQRQLSTKFGKIRVIDSSICTCCRDDLWSYRRNQTQHRIWNIIKGKDDHGKEITNA